MPLVSPLTPVPPAQWLRRQTYTQQTWVQFLVVPTRVTGGGTKGSQPIPTSAPVEVLPILVGSSKANYKTVNNVKLRRFWHKC